MLGKVYKFTAERGYGFLEDEEGGNRFFHVTEMLQSRIPAPGDVVQFEPATNERGLIAKKIGIVRNEPHRIVAVQQPAKTTAPPVPLSREAATSLLRNVGQWMVEARLEDSNRYFCQTADVQFIEDGSKCYVIGRKGTGKTAISEYLFTEAGPTRFSKKLTFKNFPFNDLYKLENSQYRPPNQYITLWKYLIYSSVAQMMQRNQNISLELRNKLDSIYTDEPVESLSRKITKWTSTGFKVTVLGTGGEFNAKECAVDNEKAWVERTEILERMIVENVDDSTYFILFDELDEDYRDVNAAEKHNQYISLLTSLFKATQDVKSTFVSTGHRIFPVIFLRDDIYDLMQDPDKTKWGDLSLQLDWNTEKIKKVLSYRLSKALNRDGEILDFNSAWRKMFSDAPVKYGNRQHRQIPIFDYITRSTHLRPRDYIRYLKECAQDALTKDRILVGPDTVVRVDKAFSNYLRSEIEDEIQGMLPEIRKIMDVLSQMRKQEFTVREFTNAYARHIKNENLPDRGSEYILKTLFHFSVIGNVPRQRNFSVFRYVNKEARINFTENICVHRGLFKALQIL
jgi:cold shock CspA family protein